jgi:hypothetical protein
MPVTELDIEAAVLAVEEAAADVTAAEQLPLGPGAGLAWAAAQGRLRHATAAHERLVQQHAAEQEAEAAAVAAETGAAKRLTAMGKELGASRDKLAAAMTAAQAALVALLDAAAEHDGRRAECAREVVDLGLGVTDGVTRDSCATRSGALRVRGEWWLPVDRAALLTLLTARVSATRIGMHGSTQIELRRVATMLGLHNRRDLLLEEIPLPEDITRATPTLQAADYKPERLVGASWDEEKRFDQRRRADDELRRLMNSGS